MPSRILITHILSHNGGMAGIGRYKIYQYLYGSGFAGAVRAEEAKHLALMNIKGEGIQCLDRLAAETFFKFLGYAFDFYHGFLYADRTQSLNKVFYLIRKLFKIFDITFKEFQSIQHSS